MCFCFRLSDFLGCQFNSNDERSHITSAAVCKREDINGILAVVDARFLYWIPIQYLDSYEDSCCVADLSVAVPVSVGNPASNINRQNRNQNTNDNNANTNTNASENANENENKTENESKENTDNDLDMRGNMNRRRMQTQFGYLGVKNIIWSPCSKRIIVKYNENSKILALCSFDRQHLYPIGIMQQVHPNYQLKRACDAIHVIFRDNIKRGALVAVLWDSGVITQHRLMFE